MENLEWEPPPLRTTSWESYKMDLEAILKSAPIRFHSKENLKLAAQYVSDAIKEAYESNCPEKSKHPPTKIL